MANIYSSMFKRVFNFTRFFSRQCGADLIREDYRMNWRTWSVIGLVNTVIAFTFYTIYIGVTIENDWSEALKCLCMFGTGIQGYAKLINGLKRPQVFRFLYNEIIEIYMVYEQKTKNYHQLLYDSIKLVKQLIAILILIVLLVSAAVIGVPILYQIAFNKRIFIMHFFFPYLDYETELGFYLTSIFHVVCIVFGTTGNFVSDAWCFVFAAHIPLIKNILQEKYKELDELLIEDNRNDHEVRDSLIEIFKWHQKYNVFCNTVEFLFFWVIFVQVAMEFMSIVCTIVCIYLDNWPAAPFFLIYSLVLFYFHCALGNLVQISNDDVTLMVYDSCWYKLTVPQQKMVLIMLRKSQQARGMSIGGVAPLTLHTALRLTKTIYTFSMMLRNFLK